MNVDSDRTIILLPSGPAEITYFLTVAESSQILPSEETTQGDDNSILYVTGGALAAAVIAAIAIKMRAKPRQTISSTQTASMEEPEPFNIEKVLEMPDLREDDKDIIKFIHENGGSALETDLRKKFLLPRTTMWRAVKRLERHSLIEITKKDQQNLIKLTNVEVKSDE